MPNNHITRNSSATAIADDRAEWRQDDILERVSGYAEDCGNTDISEPLGRVQRATMKNRQHLSEAPQRSELRRLATSGRLHYHHLILIGATLLSLTVGQSRGQDAQLPTVIVRGFLNYRTTVDGTVLLFTPDASQQQQQQQPASAAQPKATSMATIEPTASASQPPKSFVYTETLARQIEPTSVLSLGSTTPAGLLQTTHLDSSSFRQQQQPQQPPPPPQAIAADSPQARPDEWRPIQMTPPLSTVAPLQTSLARTVASKQPSEPDSPSASTNNQDNNQPNNQPKPSVQADDIPAVPQQTTARPRNLEAGSDLDAPIRPRRPSLGFSGQSLRPRVPGTGGAVSPSLQSRARISDNTTGPANSINGIRKPGLAPVSAQHSQPSIDPVVVNNVSSAFQSRLSNASNRLKNRFKHRNQLALTQTAASPSAPAAGSTPILQQLKPMQHNSMVAPESLLDVASSIEQPTSAARSLALIPQTGRTGLGLGEPSLPAPANPVVGSDEAVVHAVPGAAESSPGLVSLESVASSNGEPGGEASAPVGSANPVAGGELQLMPMTAEQQAGRAALSRAGEQRMPDNPEAQQQQQAASAPRVMSGQLQQGSLSSGPLNLDSLFMSDQPGASSQTGDHSSSSELAVSHVARPSALNAPPPRHMKSHAAAAANSTTLNGKLNGWLGQHHNKFVPRPPVKAHSADQPEQNLSHQLAANLQQLAPTPAATANQPSVAGGGGGGAALNTIDNQANQTAADGSPALNDTLHTNNATTLTIQPTEGSPEPVSLQTITRTYSTIIETSRTRLVPMQVRSSTGIVTVTEDYILTKMMTAYQTIPANAEFILADQQLSTRAPYELFEAPQHAESESKIKSETASPPIAAPAIAASAPTVDTQEQPISLDDSPKSANNWLHDFSNLDNSNGNSQSPLAQDFGSTSQQQALMSMLEQRARDANLAAAGFPLMSANGEPLDQLASQLDPSSLLADGAINIPDLNNPLVLAAAIQNPQLAAVILAAQQLKFKRQQQQQQLKPGAFPQQQAAHHQLQPSYSTSFSTTVRPSTYTARDTMYTTRLVSFRDGRTVRTRTVSEPGSVVEQVLTTIVTETIPVTIAIKPTGVLAAASSPATAVPGGANSPLNAQNNQATINNALFATQLANILARRNQQLQTSFNNPILGLGQANAMGASATPQQLLALQQFIGQQQKRQQPVVGATSPQQQFQPNFQQLLQQSMGNSTGGALSGATANQQGARPAAANGSAAQPSNAQLDQQQHRPTPLLQQAPKSVVNSAQAPAPLAAPANAIGAPLTTTLTSLQTRTYTVHNAFKTIFRTITSTVLIPTVLAPGATLLPNLMG